MRLRRLLATIKLAVLAAALPPGAAFADEKFVLDIEQKAIPSIIVYSTATSSSGCTVGVHGCLMSASFASVASVTDTGPDASLAMLPYPARVRWTFFDSGSNGTLACTASSITGIAANGERVTDNTGALAEGASGVTSSYVFSKITSVSATGCSGGGTSDVLRLNVSPSEVGLGVYMSGTTDVQGVAYAADSAESSWHTATSGYTVVGRGYGIEFASATWTGTNPTGALDTHRVLVRGLGRRYLKWAGGQR